MYLYSMTTLSQHSAKKHRANIYINTEEYNLFRATLILKGMSVSEWIRQTITQFLEALDDEEIKKQIKIVKRAKKRLKNGHANGFASPH